MTRAHSFLYEIEHLTFSYSLGQGNAEVLHDLCCTIPNGSLITLSGPSGSGKSTLLNILGLIEPLQSGRVLFQGEELGQMGEQRKNWIRRYKIGFIFQQFHLIPVLTAEENVSYFLFRQQLEKKEIVERTRTSLEAVGLWEHRKKKPSQLSGGQQQRVAIARAIAKMPDIIIGDEVTANLDQKTGRGIIELLSGLVAEKKISILLTTHDSMVQSFAHQNIHLQDGEIVG